MGATGEIAGDENFKLSGTTQVNMSKTNRLNETLSSSLSQPFEHRFPSKKLENICNLLKEGCHGKSSSKHIYFVLQRRH